MRHEELEARRLLAADLGFKAELAAETDSGSDYFYYADGTQFGLEPISGQFMIGLDHGASSDVSDLVVPESTNKAPWFNDAMVMNGRLGVFAADVDVSWGPEFDQVLADYAVAEGLDLTTLWSAPAFRSVETGLRHFVTDEIIVALDEGVAAEDFFSDAMYATYRSLRGTTDQFVATLADGGGMGALDLVNQVLPNDPDVVWSTVNFVSEVDKNLTPNDPQYSNQWHSHNTGQSGATSDADADLPAAWDDTTGSDDVVIAIVDDGVQTNHPDLDMWVNPGEVAGNGIDDDGNGWIDDVNGINIADLTQTIDGVVTVTGDNPALNDPSPTHAEDNHGTSVAGVAAAEGNNGIGTAGAAFNSKIMGVKFITGYSGTNGSGMAVEGNFFNTSALSEAIYYTAGRTADGMGVWRSADVSNHSYSVGTNSSTTTAFDWAAANGRFGKGVPAFVATGNAADDAWASTNVNVSIPFSIFNSGAQIEFRYTKDGSQSHGADTVWISDVRMPGGIHHRFDGSFDGWAPVNAGFCAVDDLSHTWGNQRWAIRACDIGNNEWTGMRSPEFETSGDVSFRYWISSEEDYDGLEIWVRTRDALGSWGSFNQAGGLISGIAEDSGGYRTDVSYPARLGSTIGVGASTDFDYRSAYSQYSGGGLDFVAPSSGGTGRIYTADRTGSAGYGSGDVTTSFGGTSSASPLAAGVGALLISQNPELTANEVRNAITATADDDFNTFLTNYSIYLGAGRIDANDAVDFVGTDDNDSISEATTVAIDGSVNGAVDIGTDVDMYRISATAGQRLGFDIDRDDLSRTDSYIRLFDSSGTLIVASDDDAGPSPEDSSLESYLEYTVPTTGNYYLGVSAFNNSSYNATDGSGDSDAIMSRLGAYTLFVNDLTDESLVVTTTSDSGNGVTYDGVTLREAIEYANTKPGADTITFDTGGVFATAQTVTLGGSQLEIASDLTIDGPGADMLTIDANQSSRVFNVNDGDDNAFKTVTVAGVTIDNGMIAGAGGGVISREHLTIDRSTITGNESTGVGGGIYSLRGDLNVLHSTISDNAAGRGGGIGTRVVLTGDTLIENSTISGNTAGRGGGIFNYAGFITIRSSTITDNDSANGAGISTFNGSSTYIGTEIGSSIVSGNNGTDLSSSNTAGLGFNVFGNSGGFVTPDDLVGVDPQLQSLADNGGPTMTHALTEGSPAINAADPAISSGDDQNGNSRVIGGVADIGAVEANPPVVDLLGGYDVGSQSSHSYDIQAGEVAFYKLELLTDVTSANGLLLDIDTLTSTISGDNDTELALFDDQGDRVAQDDDGAGVGYLSRLTFGDGGLDGDLNAGIYYLAIANYNAFFGATDFEATTNGSDSGSLVVNIDLNPAPSTIDADFNDDGMIDGIDIDALQANIVTGPADPATYDLTGDGMVTIADRDEWLVQAGNANIGAPYLLADANLDGFVDVSDLNIWSANKFASSSDWTRGDFNADGFVDVSDLNIWNGNKFMTTLPTVLVADPDDDAKEVVEVDSSRLRIDRVRGLDSLDVDAKEEEYHLRLDRLFVIWAS